MIWSHSRLNCAQACSFKFSQKYLLDTKPDIDWSPAHSLRVGSAFHKVMELCQDNPLSYRSAYLQQACDENGLGYDVEGAKIACMVREWFSHALDYKCVANELHIEANDMQMYIDAIYIKQDKWLIIDRKTATIFDKNINKKLATNQQCCIYVNNKNDIAEKLNLDPAAFGGFGYFEVKKPMHKYKAGETFDQFTQRCKSDYRETILTNAELKVDFVMDNVKKIIASASLITPENACRNYGACMLYNSPCEYWSLCHDELFSSSGEAKEEALF